MSLDSAKTQNLASSIRRHGLLSRFRGDWSQVIAWVLVLLYIVTFTWLAIQRHASFNSSGFDLGIYDQVVWNTLHGRIFFYTTTGQPLLHLSNHADPILFLVAPFYLIYSGPEMLLFLQAAAIGLGGLPVFWLAREKLESDFAALSLLVAYLLFPTLAVVTLWDFHPPALAVGFLMYAFYFLVKRRPFWFLLFAVLAMMCKEHIALVVAFMGLYAVIRYRDWSLGGLTIVLAMGYFTALMYWIIPTFSVTGDHLFLGFYSYLGDSPLEIIVTAVTRPDLVLGSLSQPAKLALRFPAAGGFARNPDRAAHVRHQPAQHQFCDARRDRGAVWRRCRPVADLGRRVQFLLCAPGSWPEVAGGPTLGDLRSQPVPAARGRRLARVPRLLSPIAESAPMGDHRSRPVGGPLHRPNPP
jgi:hypothetical protein